MNLVDLPIEELQLNKELTAEGFSLESVLCIDHNDYEVTCVDTHGRRLVHPIDSDGMHLLTQVITRRTPAIEPSLDDFEVLTPSLDDFEVLTPSGESRKVLGVFPFPCSTLQWVIIEDGDGDPQALLLSLEPINTEGRYRLQRKPKKRKAVFIKTLKELVDSGWDLNDEGDALVLSSKGYSMGMDRLCCFGKERNYDARHIQQDWFWAAEALIEKEKVR
jgi:hypothetical protein